MATPRQATPSLRQREDNVELRTRRTGLEPDHAGGDFGYREVLISQFL